jgi:hypothetical protein
MSTGSSSALRIAGRDLQVSGSILRTARLQGEFYVPFADADALISELRQSSVRVDIVTLLEDIGDPSPKYPFHYEAEQVAILPITTYDAWFTKQLYNKPRNALRKALKSGVVIRLEEFSDSLVLGIKSIYDESPVRQGRRNRHYLKDLATLRTEHSTFLDRSQFITAYCGDEMIGFAKLTFSPGTGGVMNFLSKIGHRDKAANNAILAKAVEVCADRRVRRLVYGVWGRGGAKGLVEFKMANGFQCVEVPRYYVPLTVLGTLALRAGIHGGVVARMPERYVTAAASLRERWNGWKFKRQPV